MQRDNNRIYSRLTDDHTNSIELTNMTNIQNNIQNNIQHNIQHNIQNNKVEPFINVFEMKPLYGIRRTNDLNFFKKYVLRKKESKYRMVTITWIVYDKGNTKISWSQTEFKKRSNK